MKDIQYYAVLVLFILLIPHSVTSKGENRDSSQKEKRPDHITTALYQRIEGPDKIINTCDISSIDTFNINDSASIHNYFFFTYNNIETDIPVPAEFYTIKETFGFTLNKARFLFGFTNNTNRPFASFDDFTITSVMYYEIYKAGNHSISFNVTYSSLINRNIGLPIPIPLISYTFSNDELDFTIGMLTRIVWKPVRYFTLRYRYIPVASVFTAFEFRPLPFMILGTEYSYDRDVYMINGREDKKENLFYEYHRAGERISFYIHRNIAVIAFAGYQFGASYIYGKSEFKRYQGEYRVQYKLDNAYIVQAGLRLLFQ